jgi:hypothetical protein
MPGRRSVVRRALIHWSELWLQASSARLCWSRAAVRALDWHRQWLSRAKARKWLPKRAAKGNHDDRPLGPEREVPGGAVFGPTHPAPSTICRGATIYGGGSRCDHPPRGPTPLPKSLPCKPFSILPRVVREWHWPCLVVRDARRGHDRQGRPLVRTQSKSPGDEP